MVAAVREVAVRVAAGEPVVEAKVARVEEATEAEAMAVVAMAPAERGAEAAAAAAAAAAVEVTWGEVGTVVAKMAVVEAVPAEEAWWVEVALAAGQREAAAMAVREARAG